jgi:hypothetical protein
LAARQQFQYQFDGDPRAADDGFAGQDVGICNDTIRPSHNLGTEPVFVSN